MDMVMMEGMVVLEMVMRVSDGEMNKENKRRKLESPSLDLSLSSGFEL